MTTAGIVTMVLSLTAVLSLATFCLAKVLALPPVDREEVKGPLEIDTGDTEDAD